MKILIQPPTNTMGSIGDNALLLSLIDQLKQNVSVNEMNTLYYKVEDLQVETNIEDNIDDYKLLVFFGNDCLSYYSIRDTIINLFTAHKKKVFLINTSFGKMNTVATKNISKIRSLVYNEHIYFYIRDIYSFTTMIENFKFKNTPHLCSDLVFSLQEDKTQVFYNEKRYDNILSNIKDKNKLGHKIVVINLHNAIQFPKTIQNVMNIVKKNYRKMMFIFLSHDTRSKEKIYMENLIESHGLSNELGYNIFLEDVIPPKIEKKILKEVDIVITGRMHLAIIALSLAKPVIGLSYNGHKTYGTFKWLNAEDLVIKSDDQNIINIFHSILANYKHIKTNLSNNVKFAYHGSLPPIKDILAYYKSNVFPNIFVNS